MLSKIQIPMPVYFGVKDIVFHRVTKKCEKNSNTPEIQLVFQSNAHFKCAYRRVKCAYICGCQK